MSVARQSPGEAGVEMPRAIGVHRVRLDELAARSVKHFALGL